MDIRGGTWYGQPVEELDREQLYDIINYFANKLDEERDGPIYKMRGGINRPFKCKCGVSRD